MAHVVCTIHSDTVGAGTIPAWARGRGHTLSSARLHDGDPIPDITGADLLCIMGGPMGVYDAPDLPWLAAELAWLTELVALPAPERPRLVGVCLGAQLLAAALGADVRRHAHYEIGYWPVRGCSNDRDAAWLTRRIPSDYAPFLWHGDTFEIPAGTIHVAESDGCSRQAFTSRDGSIVGLQYHPEFSQREIDALYSAHPEINIDAPFVRGPHHANEPERREQMRAMLWGMLDDVIAARAATPGGVQ